MANPKRMVFVSHETIYKVIEFCPDVEMRTLVALARFGGLRVPSEPALLRWTDVDTVNWERMLVHAPKTEHHEGHETRIVPIFPELRPFLEEAYELAVEKAEWVLPTVHQRVLDAGDDYVNFGTAFKKIIQRAKFKPWPKPFQNLRSSRQTELNDIFPGNVVTAWLGNSEKVAEKHYLQVTEDHFQKALQIPMHKPPKTAETILSRRPKKPLKNRGNP